MERLGLEHLAGPRPAGHDHDVAGVDVGQRPLGHQGQGAGVGPHRAGLLGDEHDLGARQPGEHLVGPDGVERREAVVDRDGDEHGGPASWSRSGRDGEQPPVLAGGGAHDALERAVHGLDRAEAAGSGDVVHRAVGRLEQSAGGLDP